MRKIVTVKAVSFDGDGTLWDFDKSMRSALAMVLKELEDIDERDFPEEIEQIKAKLKDIEAIDELNQMLSDLREKHNANEEQKNDIKEKINNLKIHHYLDAKKTIHTCSHSYVKYWGYRSLKTSKFLYLLLTDYD